MELKGKVYYVGVNDRQKQLFENLWPLPDGVTYNSYLIDDDRIALIETVDICYFEVFIKKIRQVIGDRPIDYLIIDHMEPDHSGSLSLIKKYYPDITIVGNAKTFDMIDGFYGVEGKRLVIKEGDTLDLGYHRLQFALIPMVHWPETMVTFDMTEGILFSGDALGAFGALNGGVIDTQINTDAYWSEMERYYSNIVGKYGAPVQKALAKLKNLPITMACTTHGPIWTKQLPRVLDLYDRLSRYEAEEGVVIAYGTMYGNTEMMAETIAEELSEQGIRNIVIDNVSHKHHSFIIRDVFKYKGLIIGCPTYNANIYPETEALLSELASRDIKHRYLGWFGSFSWAGAAVKKIGEYNEKLKFEQVGTPVEMKQAMNPAVEAECRTLAKAMADRLKADRSES
ncbi:FprA family A-type flavoprotein [Phocaeicola abscessus]|uniref:FprA family A-type flavoprotein n=1 Tax=Phocaeicola abscessus TaxID=555313 RepID=UPI0004B6DA78|nr:FprA family A-type flavoprotein [Phocaeicola abscessus]